MKTSGDRPDLEITGLAAPSAEDFWSMLQKYLSFDEPSSRCARLKKAVAKQLKAPPSKDIDLNSTSQYQQDCLFDAVFGGRPSDNASRLLSVLLGLEEIARFDEIAFASWANEIGPEESNGNQSSDFWQGLRQWFEGANLSASQTRWLMHCALTTPAWIQLTSAGPWSDDPIKIFLLNALEQVKILVSTRAPDTFDPKVFARAHAQFTKLLAELRAQLPGDFLPQVIVIVEGPTEAVLLPRFAASMGIDLQANAIMIIPAGGAKQVSRRYLFLRDLVALPIVCILDRDAEEQAGVINDTIRDCDKLFVLEAGEIEDTFEIGTFVRQLNLYLESFHGSVQPLSTSDFPSKVSRKIILNKLWKARKLGDFDKIAFAESIARNLNDEADVPREVVIILKFLAEVAAEHV